MQAPQWMARFNKYVTNPVQRMWAGRLPGMAILEHVGRRSGKTYRTPLIAFRTDDGVAVLLTYGPDRDWLKNVVAAGEARMQRHGSTCTVTASEVMSKSDAVPHLSGPGRTIFPLLPFDEAVLLRRA